MSVAQEVMEIDDDGWTERTTGIVDWTSSAVSGYSHLPSSQDQASARLAGHIAEYLLNDGAIEESSEDEMQERDDMEESSSTIGEDDLDMQAPTGLSGNGTSNLVFLTKVFRG